MKNPKISRFQSHPDGTACYEFGTRKEIKSGSKCKVLLEYTVLIHLNSNNITGTSVIKATLGRKKMST